MSPAPMIDARTLGLVVLGGVLGVGLRALILLPLGAPVAPLVVPAVTLVVNVVGSLLLGIVVGTLDDRHPRLRAFLGTGVMGGFTTYSAFAVQTAELSAAQPLFALALAALSVVVGVLAGAAGLAVGRVIARTRGHIEEPEEAE
ncbi:fluoride efflux transporter FluC [Microbacterium sp. P03]|uniref:fluoride efflux transporter FluC n=1 Tax=Microbacterium sp. P03 TaxID=3366946 RepID=UPI003745515F